MGRNHGCVTYENLFHVVLPCLHVLSKTTQANVQYSTSENYVSKETCIAQHQPRLNAIVCFLLEDIF